MEILNQVQDDSVECDNGEVWIVRHSRVGGNLVATHINLIEDSRLRGNDGGDLLPMIRMPRHNRMAAIKLFGQ